MLILGEGAREGFLKKGLLNPIIWMHTYYKLLSSLFMLLGSNWSEFGLQFSKPAEDFSE